MTLGWKIVALFLFVIVAFGSGLKVGVDHVTLQRDLLDAQREVQYEKQVVAMTARRDAAQKRLDEGAEKQRIQDAGKIAVANANADALARELRTRPERPKTPASGVPSTASARPAAGSTGAELYRPDAEFLVRLARTAEFIRTQRDSCYQRFDAARKELQQYNDNGKVTQ